jgi:hypothetical protein
MITTTQKVIEKMLKENTGIHMLDSGRTYGRHWQHNQLVDFPNTQQVIVSFDKYISFTKSIYWFLSTILEYHNKLDHEFRAFDEVLNERCKESGILSCTWEESIAEWKKFLKSKNQLSEPYFGYTCDYTYNSENCMSQDFIYDCMCIDDEEVVIIQIHNGCDARGGFTSPRIFTGEIDSLLMGISSGYIQCSNNQDHSWYTDDAYHWYNNNDKKQLEDYEFRELTLEIKEEQECNKVTVFAGQYTIEGEVLESNQSHIPNYSNESILYYDDNGTGYCPLCGGQLFGYS